MWQSSTSSDFSSTFGTTLHTWVFELETWPFLSFSLGRRLLLLVTGRHRCLSRCFCLFLCHCICLSYLLRLLHTGMDRVAVTNYAVRASSPPMVERSAHLDLPESNVVVKRFFWTDKRQPLILWVLFLIVHLQADEIWKPTCSPPSHVQWPLCTRESSSHKPSLVWCGRSPWSLSRTPACRWARQQDDTDDGEEEGRGGRAHDPSHQRPNLPEEPPWSKEQDSNMLLICWLLHPKGLFWWSFSLELINYQKHLSN